jgi:hypothetical protein
VENSTSQNRKDPNTQRYVDPQVVKLGQIEVSREELNQMNQVEYRALFGEQLYPRCREKYPKVAGKICGIIMQSIEGKEQIFLLNDPELMDSKIDEAYNLIKPQMITNKQTIQNLTSVLVDGLEVSSTVSHAEVPYFTKVISSAVGKVRWDKNFLTSKTVTSSPSCITLFGDNDRDFFRGPEQKRNFNGGMASVCGPVDRLFTYGIVTTFYDGDKPKTVSDYNKYLNMHKYDLQRILHAGFDIRVPAPNPKYAEERPEMFYRGEKQVVKHSLGTGIANLSQELLIAIQNMLDTVQDTIYEYAEQNSLVDIPVMANEDSMELIQESTHRRVNLRKMNNDAGSRKVRFRTCSEFNKFLDVHMEVVRGALDADLGYDVQQVLDHEFTQNFTSNQSEGVARRTNKRNEMLFGDTSTFPNLCLRHSGKPPLLAKKFPTLITRAGQLASAKFSSRKAEFIMNGCLVNQYLDGKSCCGLHLDDEDDHDGNILMIHIGAPRNFTMTSKRGRGAFTKEIEMAHGDAILTDTSFAQNVLHGKLPDNFCEDEHYTLTYRYIYAKEKTKVND